MLVLTSFLSLILFSGFVSAVNIGVSPATVTFHNVLRGGYAQGQVVVSADSVAKTNISVDAVGNISSWLNFSKNFSASKENPHVLTISVTPPADTPNGNYTGFVRISASAPQNTSSGGTVGIVKSSLDVYVTVQVVDTQIIQCSAAKYSVNSVEQGDDIVFNVNVTNTGNVIIQPRVTIDVWDESQTNIVKSLDTRGDQILPTREKQLSFRISSAGMPTSQYWADISAVDCLSSTLLTFDVLKPGALKANGLLTSILSPKEAKVGDTIPIEASFKNTGEKEVSAQFRGQVTKSGKIVQLLDSPSSNIAINDIGTFTFYFTPKSPGDYVISGRVYYDGKQSYEQSTTFTVTSSSPFSVILPLVYGLLIVLIAFLFLKILKEKKNYKKILRRFKK
jgi:hypothetical protein